jgi:hypothetical protein
VTKPKQGSPDAGEVAAGLRIVRGSVDDEELAALVAGMVAMVAARGASEEAASPTSAWMDRGRTLRGRPGEILARGEAAWRHSLR